MGLDCVVNREKESGRAEQLAAPLPFVGGRTAVSVQVTAFSPPESVEGFERRRDVKAQSKSQLRCRRYHACDTKGGHDCQQTADDLVI